MKDSPDEQDVETKPEKKNICTRRQYIIYGVVGTTLAAVVFLLVYFLVIVKGGDDQTRALKAFGKHTNVGGWKTNTNWNSGKNVCEWYGISCNEDKEVTAIRLHDNNLDGSIVSDIGRLTMLTALDLSQKDLPLEIYHRRRLLSSSFPSEMGKLTNLVELNVNSQFFSGTLPNMIEGLKTLSVANNYMVDVTFSEIIERYPSLERLDLSSLNSMYRTFIPSTIGILSKLESLVLDKSYILHPLPEDLFQLSQLTELSLTMSSGGNYTIPKGLAFLPHLEKLSLRGSNLSGEIPSFLFQKNLKKLDLSNNDLAGTFPTEFAFLTGLTELGIGSLGKFLDGSLPDTLKSLTNLEVLDISMNSYLNGTLPDYIWSSWTKMKHFNIEYSYSYWNCNSTFPLPVEASLWTDIEHFDANNNGFGGSLPSEVFAAWKKLTFFDIGNHLTGTLPATIGMSSKLVYGKIDGELTGTFPSEVGLLTNLNRLNIGGKYDNSTPIPSEVCTLLNYEKNSEPYINWGYHAWSSYGDEECKGVYYGEY